MASLEELEYKLEIGARRTRVVVYEEHVEFNSPFPLMGATDKDGESTKVLPTEPSRFEQYNYMKRMKARRQTIRELVYNNFDTPNTTMITLTFDSQQFPSLDFTDLKIAHKEFKKFIQRINFRFDNFKYVATFSRQENQNWHYHLICNISNSISKAVIEAIWNRGHVWLTYIFKESVLRDKVNYCIDNMEEIAYSDLRMEKGYLASKGLRRNIVLHSWKPEEAEAAEELFNQIKNEPHTLLYSTTHLKGTKIKSNLLPGVAIYNTGLNSHKSGADDWVAKTHYISSSVLLKQLFPLLPEAKLKKK